MSSLVYVGGLAGCIHCLNGMSGTSEISCLNSDHLFSSFYPTNPPSTTSTPAL